MISKVFAGVGKPMKYVCWFSSILNFPNLYADAIGIKNAKNGKKEAFTPDKLKYEFQSSEIKASEGLTTRDNNLNIIIPGTNPLVIMSAKESNCIPKSLCTSSFLAINPSKKSKKIPRKTKMEAITKLPLAAKITATLPQKTLSKVIMFGKCLFNVI